jgi:serine/threonine protein kinase
VSTSLPQASGQRFGRYVLIEMIGKGGMAEVYRAVAHGLEGFQRVFVIKRILKDKSTSPEFVEMFVNEARISALLNHPNIVQIYDFGQIEGSYFLAMEHVRGKDLLSVLRQLRATGKHMSAEVAAYIAQQVALGLDYAHTLSHAGKNLKIVHRDVSPSNVMLLRAGGVKLLDFGIAKAAMEIKTENETQAGLVKGKLSYVSPEQIKGAGNIDGRSDVFALGVVLWESLTGRRLFFDRNDFQTMRNVVERPVPPPSTQRADVPAALDFIVLRALERDPTRRYPDARTMADELEAVLQEARFAPRAMTRMLDELFGEQNPNVELVPEVPSAVNQLSATPQASPGTVRLEAAGVPAVPPGQLPILEDDEESYTGVSSVRRLPVKPRRSFSWMAAAAGLALTVAGGAALVGSRRHKVNADDVAVAKVPPEPLEPATAPAAPAPVEPPVSATITGPAATPLSEDVSVKISTDPAGAEVSAEDGIRLGTTPTTLSIHRSDKPLILVISKMGYTSSKQSIVPDRDVSALFNLRADEEAAKKRPAPPARPRHHSVAAPSDGRVREGLSIDPFAEDPKGR